MTLLVVLTVVVIALLIAELAIYLFVVGSQLNRCRERFGGVCSGRLGHQAQC